MSIRSNLTGIILAGGEGRRMDGQDKGWIELLGKPLIRHVLERVSPQVGACIISANRNLERYRELQVPVVTDRDVYLGPLAGIAAALEMTTTEWALVVPTDAPLIPTDLAEQLMKSVGDGDKLVLCHDGERLQPLCGLYRRDLAPSIRTFLAAGERRLTQWCLAQNPQIVTIRDTFAFSNLNTRDELTRIESALQSD